MILKSKIWLSRPWFIVAKYNNTIIECGWDQEAGGVRHGAHILPHFKKKKKNPFACRTICTEHLLNAGIRP